MQYSSDPFPIVCLSTQLWDDPMWTNKQHVMSRMAERGHQVLYVDPLIRVRKFGYRTLRGKINPRQLLTGVSHPAENLWRYTPVKYLFSEKAETALAMVRIRHLMYSLGMKDAVLWVYDPEFAAYTKALPHRVLVYDCVDDYAHFPPSRYPKGKAWILEKEDYLVRTADIVFASAQALYESRKEKNAHTYYTPNVADDVHNARALRESTLIPSDINSLPRPIIGFQGALASYKIDLALIDYLATSHPEWSLVLIGPKAPVDPRTDLSSLQKRPNVHFLGVKPYEQLPAYYKAFDVAIMPSMLNEYTASSFPLKFFEYLGAGLPVVSTRLPALEDFYAAGVADFASDHAEFLAMVELNCARGKEYHQQDRLALAARYSWESKVDTLEELVRDMYEKKGA